jgi:hypothetical protein
MTRCAVAAALVAVSLTGCRGGSADGPHTVAASSDVYTVAGQYSRVPLDRVDGLTIEQGKLMLHGPPANIAIDLPAGARAERPTRHWALVSDAHLEGRRLVTFTETESVTPISPSTCPTAKRRCGFACSIARRAVKYLCSPQGMPRPASRAFSGS